MTRTHRNNIAKIMKSDYHAVEAGALRSKTLRDMVACGLLLVTGSAVVITDQGYTSFDPTLADDRQCVAKFLAWAQPERDRSYWAS